MSEIKKLPALVWLDLEMSGLDPDSERIIEIATLVTSSDLEEIIEGPNLVINKIRNLSMAWTNGIFPTTETLAF